MESFTNETIDTTRLPRFEEVQFTKLHPFYWKVLLINLSITLIIVGVLVGVACYNIEELIGLQMQVSIAYVVLALLVFYFSYLGFKRKAYAFREHDVLYRHGVIASTTIVIPYNRVQHVALHEGIVSRFFGLAEIEIFTAGGNSSDISIPGIEKLQAEDIKQLLMGKIQKQL